MAGLAATGNQWLDFLQIEGGIDFIGESGAIDTGSGRNEQDNDRQWVSHGSGTCTG